MFHIFLPLFLLQTACEDSTSSESPSADLEPKEAPRVPPPLQQPPVSSSGFDPLQGRSLQEICSANGLLLIKWPYPKIQKEFRTLCCVDGGLSSDAYQCEMDWPFSDVPSCEAYDELRNEIFARYGRAFKTEKWQAVFAATDWYQIRSDFSNDWLSDVANQNVAHLLKRKKEKVACMD